MQSKSPPDKGDLGGSMQSKSPPDKGDLGGSMQSNNDFLFNLRKSYAN